MVLTRFRSCSDGSTHSASTLGMYLHIKTAFANTRLSEPLNSTLLAEVHASSIDSVRRALPHSISMFSTEPTSLIASPISLNTTSSFGASVWPQRDHNPRSQSSESTLGLADLINSQHA